MLTGNKYVDGMILNKLEDKDLVKACQVNKKAKSLCNDQVFWMNRIFLRYPYVSGDVLRKYKGDRSWSEYYIKDLRKINEGKANAYLETGAHYGRLDHVIISLKKGANPDPNPIFRANPFLSASGEGHLDIVKYLFSLTDPELHSKGIVSAALGGHLDVIKYLVSRGVNVHTDNVIKWAEKNNHKDIVNYVKNLKKINDHI